MAVGTNEMPIRGHSAPTTGRTGTIVTRVASACAMTFSEAELVVSLKALVTM